MRRLEPFVIFCALAVNVTPTIISDGSNVTRSESQRHVEFKYLPLSLRRTIKEFECAHRRLRSAPSAGSKDEAKKRRGLLPNEFKGKNGGHGAQQQISAMGKEADISLNSSMPPLRAEKPSWPMLPMGCNVVTGKRCRLANGKLHPAVEAVAAKLKAADSATSSQITSNPSVLRSPPASSSVSPSDSEGVEEDITDDESASLLVDWDAHHRQIVAEWEPLPYTTERCGMSSNGSSISGAQGLLCDWVAVLEARGHSHSKHCKLPPVLEEVPRKSPVIVGRAGEDRPAERMAWFFCLGFAPSAAYEAMVKSVVLSGRIKAPSLEPYFMYVMNKVQHAQYVSQGGPRADPLGAWMLALGVRVVGHVVSFANRRGFNKEKAQGAQWARLDLFKMAAHMVPEFKKRGLITSHILYTDMDLFFSHDPPLPGVNTALRSCGQPTEKFDSATGRKIKGASWSRCVRAREHGRPVKNDPNFPYVFGAGSEIFTPWGMNSGVMYINVANATQYADGLINFAAEHGYRSFSTADQACMERFFHQDNFGPNGRNAWDWLDDAVINSRGFLSPSEFLYDDNHVSALERDNAGGSKSAASGGHHHNMHRLGAFKVAQQQQSRSAIWHWHGYKADQIRCHFDRIADGSWDVTNRDGKKKTDRGPIESDVPGCHVERGSGAYPNALKGCYLVTYAWMLTQHERLQQMAKTMRIAQEGEW